MISGVPLSELATLAALIGGGGIVSGVLAGLFGIGGGSIIVPVLYELFRIIDVPADVRFQLCVGTSFAIILPTAIRSYLLHRAKGLAYDDVLRQWALPSVIGVGLGAWIAAVAPAFVFKIVFVAFVNLLAVRMLFGRDSWRLGDNLPGRAAMAGYGGVLGLLASLVGVGGGAPAAMVLMLYGRPIHNAVATGVGFAVPVTVAAVIGYMLAGWPHQAEMPAFSVGFVSLIGFALMAPISAFTAGYGVRLAHALSKRKLELMFGLFLAVVSVRFIVSLL